MTIPFEVNLAISMALSTPSVMVARWAATVPARVPWIANWAAAREVQATRAGGTTVGVSSRNGSVAVPYPGVPGRAGSAARATGCGLG